MNNVLVSICCITYNHEKFIKYALEGFLMQKTNFQVEFLINDDCSTDATSEILKEYEQKYPGFFNITFQSENQFSKGLKPFSQLLFPKVKGKYIALCEGDDYWTDPYKLQKQVNFLEQNTDYSMCFHPCKIVDENNNELILDTFIHLTEKDFTGVEILEKWSVPTASTMFRSEFVSHITNRAISKGYYYGDTPMFLTLLDYGKSHCLNDIMSAYRIHKGGISKDSSPEKFIKWFNDYKIIKSDFGGKYFGVIDKNLAIISFAASISLTKRGYWFHGIKFLLNSIIYDKNLFKRFLIRKWNMLIKRN